MTGADVSPATATEMPEVGTVDMKLEVVTVPVSDIDRAKRFYQSLGWRLDADIAIGDAFRVVQLTPTHSACSVAFGKYSAYFGAREHGKTPDEAAQAANRYMDEVLHIAALGRSTRTRRTGSCSSTTPGPPPTSRHS